MTVIEAIERLFAARGDSEYGGEAVSQREHALQAAVADGADDPLVACVALTEARVACQDRDHDEHLDERRASGGAAEDSTPAVPQR